MRKTFEPQITFGTVPMSNIKFDIFCRHELVPILMALQHLYFNKPVLNEILDLIKDDIVEDKDEKLGSPYKAVQVWEYRPILLCKHLIFCYVLPETIICNLLKLLTCIVL